MVPTTRQVSRNLPQNRSADNRAERMALHRRHGNDVPTIKEHSLRVGRQPAAHARASRRFATLQNYTTSSSHRSGHTGQQYLSAYNILMRSPSHSPALAGSLPTFHGTTINTHSSKIHTSARRHFPQSRIGTKERDYSVLERVSHPSAPFPLACSSSGAFKIDGQLRGQEF